MRRAVSCGAREPGGEGVSRGGGFQATARAAMQGDPRMLLPALGIHLDPCNFV